jgi:5'(3')-deoxyribonucleotidase
MRLGIDLDGVVADFNSGWMKLYNAEFSAALEAHQVIEWDGLYSLTHFGSTGDFWTWARGTDRPSIFRNLDTFPGALETLESLSLDHQIVIITTKPRWAIPDTFAWIGDKRIPTREVHITRRKWEVECDVYLEDSPAHLPAIVARRPGATVCRFVRPWNDPVPGAHDISDWQDFANFVAELQESP